MLTFEKFSTKKFSKVDKMAPISPFSHFPVANFSAQRSRVRVYVSADIGGAYMHAPPTQSKLRRTVFNSGNDIKILFSKVDSP